MRYIERSLERKFWNMNAFFKVLLVTGARQVGKTTMLKHLAQGQNRSYVSMDNAIARDLAKRDPVLFFQTYKPPIIIDEIQKAPELFEQIKVICDASDERGMFWLTGSQQFDMMKNVSETLAGRIGILQLYSMTKNEIENVNFDNEMDFSLPCLLVRQQMTTKNNVIDIFEHIWRGGMPQVLEADAEQRLEYYNSYVETYLMRDVMELGNISDTLRFRRFLTACAALIGEQVNFKKLADTAEISQVTAKHWLFLLQGLGIVYLLQPYANNALKRLTKTSKLYFCDTGLCAFLSSWLTKETLMNGAANGHYFENFVVMELVKDFAYSPQKVSFSYYRDSNAKEIDLLIERGSFIHPLEIKKSANPDQREIKKFAVLQNTALKIGGGGILCMCEEVIPIDENNAFIPCNLL